MFTPLSLWDNQSGACFCFGQQAESPVTNPEPSPGFGLFTQDPFFGCLLEHPAEFVAEKETGWEPG